VSRAWKARVIYIFYVIFRYELLFPQIYLNEYLDYILKIKNESSFVEVVVAVVTGFIFVYELAYSIMEGHGLDKQFVDLSCLFVHNEFGLRL
jgi:thiaminase